MIEPTLVVPERLSKPRRTLKWFHADMMAFGPTGSYGRRVAAALPQIVKRQGIFSGGEVHVMRPVLISRLTGNERAIPEELMGRAGAA